MERGFVKDLLQRFLNASPVKLWGTYVLVFAIPRIVIFATLGNVGFWRVMLYFEYGRLMEVHGIWNVWTYSSSFNYIIYGLWQLGKLLFPANPVISFWALWIILLTIADFFTSILLYRVVTILFNRKRGWQIALLYAFLPTSLMFYTDFNVDPLVVFLTIASLYYFVRRRSIRSAVTSAIGGSLKVFSWLMLPVVVISDISYREKAKWFISFVITGLVIYSPHLLMNPVIALGPYKWQAGRMPWETVYALGLWLMNYPLPESSKSPFWKDAGIFDNWSYYQCGITPPTSLNVAPVPDYTQWWGLLSLSLMFIAVVMLIFLKKAHTNKEIVLSLLYLISISLAINYGWSGNFLAYLALLLLISGVRYNAILCFVLYFMSYFEFPLFYFGGLEAARSTTLGLTPPMSSLLLMYGYWLTIVVRTITIIVISITAWIYVHKRNFNYAVRLPVDQLKYLKERFQPSQWIRKAIDEMRKRE